MAVDLQRLGGLGWLQATNGSLSKAEWRRLRAEVLRAQTSNLAGRLKLALGRRPSASMTRPSPPDSQMTREAESIWREQGPALVEHSMRTWLFGEALASVDSIDLDPELFYVGCLLHDSGILRSVTGEDFTLRSGVMAAYCVRRGGGSQGAADTVADAIAIHASPGVTVAQDGALGCYIQAGAMLDLGGLRVWDLPGSYVDDVSLDHPRSGLQAEVLALIKAETQAVPDGRFALLSRWGLPLAIRISPM